MVLLLSVLAACGAASSTEPAAEAEASSAVEESGPVSAPASAQPGTPAEAGVATAEVATPLDFDLATVDGGQLSSASLKGQDVALWFWAPWCPSCNREAPDVADVVATLPDDVTVIGVAGRDQLPPMAEFVDRHGLRNIDHVADLELQIWNEFDIVGQPAWVFIDGQTGEVERILGPLGAAALTEKLTALAA